MRDQTAVHVQHTSARTVQAGGRHREGQSSSMTKPVTERELIQLQIQAYEFYAGLIDRAVVGGSHEAKMPRWDEQRAIEYRDLAEQLRQRLAALDASNAATLDKVGEIPVPTHGE